jgi:hypothetical protein
MARKDGRKQTEGERRQPVVEGSAGDISGGGSGAEAVPESAVSQLAQGFAQYMTEVNEFMFEISRLSMAVQTKTRNYAKELERIKQMNNIS